MNRVYVITHRKDNHILGICRNERAVQRRLAFLKDESALYTVDDACVDVYEVCG